MRQLPVYFLLFAAIFYSFKHFGTQANPENLAEDSLNDRGIVFIEQDWERALEIARIQNKPIFFDAYASWCGPCKKMKREVFTDPSVGDYFNEHFINIAVDMEKGMGAALAEKFLVSAYPTLLIIDLNGKVINKSVGFLKPKELVQFAKKLN